MSWPRGRWFPVFRPYTPVSPLGIPAKIQIRETCTKTIADECGHIDLIVKKYPGGKASTYLHSLTPGESLRFALVLRGYRWIPNKYTHVTLIAGGAGITPMYQLARGILCNPEDRTKVTLVFGVNSDEDMLLKVEFDDLERRFPDQFKAVYTVSHPVEGSTFRKGYVTKNLLEEFGVRPEKDTKVFICGPPAMEAALLGNLASRSKGAKGILEQIGYRKDQVHKF